MKNIVRTLSALLIATSLCGTLQADERGARKGLFWGAASGAALGGIAGGGAGAGIGALTGAGVGGIIGGTRRPSPDAQKRKNERMIDDYEHTIRTYQALIADHQRSIERLNIKRASLTKQKSATARSINREMKHIDSKIKTHEKKINRLQFKIQDLERKIDRLS